MNADLTIDTLSFKMVYSDKAGSLRRETSRGVNLPTELKIAHTISIDSATKLQTRRTLVRFDRYVQLANGQIVPVSAYAVVAVPVDASVEDTDVTAVAQHLNNVLFASTQTNGLDLKDEIFVNTEQ